MFQKCEDVVLQESAVVTKCPKGAKYDFLGEIPERVAVQGSIHE